MIRDAEVSLLPLHIFGFSSSKVLLSSCFWVEYHSDCSCHVDWFLSRVVPKVLPHFFTLVSVDKINLIRFVWNLRDDWNGFCIVRCFNGSFPRQDCHEFISFPHVCNFNKITCLRVNAIRVLTEVSCFLFVFSESLYEISFERITSELFINVRVMMEEPLNL